MPAETSIEKRRWRAESGPATVVRLVAPMIVASALAAATIASAAASAQRSAGAGQQLATLSTSQTARSAPSARASSVELIAARRPITGSRTVLPVIGAATARDGSRWLDVMLPGRPNGRTGWIRQAGTQPSATAWQIVVDTSTRRVTVYDADRRIRVFKAVVGKPSTPTPDGRFFVEEDVRLPVSAVGAPFALALSARSDVLQEFEGGPGQIALHGVANVGGTLGTAASHGCIRLDSASMRWLVARIGAGVPVTISG